MRLFAALTLLSVSLTVCGAGFPPALNDVSLSRSPRLGRHLEAVRLGELKLKVAAGLGEAAGDPQKEPILLARRRVTRRACLFTSPC